MRLTAASAPFAFPADAPCTGRLVGGPVTDLNVMTRRGRFGHAVHRLDLDGPVTLDAEGGTVLVLCQEGGIAVGGTVLGPGDAICRDATLEIAPCERPGMALVAVIRPTRDDISRR